MKNIVLFMLTAVLLGACKSVDYPSIEESQAKIDLNRKKIDSLNLIVEAKKPKIKTETDLSISVGLNTLNKIMDPFANGKQEDVSIVFHETKPIFKEDKSIFGISYTNYLNIDKGSLSANLKKFRFDRFSQNKLEAILEIEGKGNISVSGKYMGVPASASPIIELYLYEPITFEMLPDGNGYLILKPQPKQLILKTKTSVKLIEWYVPWYQELPLELTDLVQPVRLPLGIKTEIKFPLPSSKNSNDKIEFVPYTLDLKNTRISLIDNKIDFGTNIEFIKKTEGQR